MWTLLANILAVLNSQSSRNQIALACALALIIGLSPLLSLHNVLVVFLVLLIKVNLSAFFLAFGVFSGLSYLTDAGAVALGEQLLQAPALQELWTDMYQSAWWRAFQFNQTLTLGSLVLALIAALPVFLLTRVLINVYRLHLLAWVEKLKVVQVLKASKFYRIYQALS